MSEWPGPIGAITLFVEDLAAARRTASFRDPGGHVWEIAHELAG